MLAKTHVVFADAIALAGWKIASALGGISNSNNSNLNETAPEWVSNLNAVLADLASEALRLAGLGGANLGASFAGGSEIFWIFLGATSLGALLPDIDEPGSFVGRKAGSLSALVKLIFGHRGATHFFIVPLLAILGAWAFCDGAAALACWSGLALGYAMHIVGDAMTISGVKGAFFPLRARTFYALPFALRFRTGGEAERLVVLPILSVILAFLLIQI